MFWTILETLHAITPFVVVLLTAMVSVGFFRLLFVSKGVVRYLSLGFLLLYFKVLTRTIYWDILSVYVPEIAWDRWIALTHGITFNVVFHLMVIAASMFSLMAIHRSIPDDRRRDYTLLTAFLYPRSPWFRGRRGRVSVEPTSPPDSR